MLVLRPSAAHRWMRCPASARLSAGLDDAPGEAAKNGTACHALAEHCLKNGEVSADDYLGEAFGPDSIKVSAEMVVIANAYLSTVYENLRPEDFLYVERKVSVLDADGIKVEGTPDCVLYDEKSKTLHVLDLKTGVNYVDAESNPQLFIYALGASSDPDIAALGVEKVRFTIVQPRCFTADPVRHSTVNGYDLWEFSQDLEAAARESADPNAPTVTGDHCRYCPAQKHDKCPARRAEFDAVFSEIVPPDVAEMFDDKELGERLTRAKLAESYIEMLVDLAKTRAKTGKLPVGWKWVSSGQSRSWSKPDLEVIQIVRDTLGVDAAETRALSPAALEALVGKAPLAPATDKKPAGALADLVARTPKHPQLVKDSDRRPAIDILTFTPGKAGQSFEDV